MKPQERYEWIGNWIKSKGPRGSADIMDSEFVASYIDAIIATDSGASDRGIRSPCYTP